MLIEKGDMRIFESDDKVFIHARRGSRGRVVCRYENAGDASPIQTFAQKIFFVLAEEGSQVEIMSVQNLSRNTDFSFRKFSHILRGARVSWTDIHIGGRSVRASTEDFLVEEGAESSIRNIILCAMGEYDLADSARHLAPNTRSKISARGVLGGGGKVSYRGAVHIGHGTTGADGRQEAKFLLASDDAEIDAVPSLDVGAYDTRSAHSLSIHYLDDMAFFYPGLRGLSSEAAREELLEGFLFGANEEGFFEDIRIEVQKKLKIL